MATLYLLSTGTTVWNTLSNWRVESATPGVPGATQPAALPGSGDDVVLYRTTSGTSSITLSTTVALCRNISVGTNITTLAFTGASGAMTVSGSMNLSGASGAVTWTATGVLTFNATTSGQTINTKAASIAGPLRFDGVGGVWTLGSNLTTTAASVLAIANGTLDTSSVGNYSITTPGALTLSASATVGLNLNNSTVNLTGFTFGTLTINSQANFNAGTSTIICSGAGGITFDGGGKTFYNVNFTGSPSTGSTTIINGQNTFNNLSFVSPSATGYRPVTFSANQTINGTLSTSGTAGNSRVWFQSSTVGMQWDLTINSAPSLTDADFRDLRIIGTAAPISGTRIGNIGGCSGITFSTPKTVYWSTSASGNWSTNVWATSAGGSISLDNFPLAQDTAVIVNTFPTTGNTITLNSGFVAAFPTIDVSGRTQSITLATATNTPLIMGDLKLSTTVTLTGSGIVTFAGRNTQTITSAGRTFPQPITIDSIGGTVNLADAMINTATSITVTNGTFNTNSFTLTAVSLISNNSNVRAINFGNSSVTLSGTTPLNFTTSTNLTFNCGNSFLTISAATATFAGAGFTYHAVAFTNQTAGNVTTVTGQNTFKQALYLYSTAAVGTPTALAFAADQTVYNLVLGPGGTPRENIRGMFRSNILGTQRTITSTNLITTAAYADFRDINVVGIGAGASVPNAGDCGGNSGITFPASKTCYWVLNAGGNWSDSFGWGSASGGTSSTEYFPLAQDTVIIENTGLDTSATITLNGAYNIGNINMSGRTNAMTFATGTTTPTIYGNVTLGSGVTPSGTGTLTFGGRGTQTITSAGKTFTQQITIDSITGTVQLADAFVTSFVSSNGLALTSGTFDAVTYPVTAYAFSSTGSATRTLKMGTSIWTLTASTSVSVWNIATTGLTYYAGTATIVLSGATGNITRNFTGGGLYYNKITIGSGIAIDCITQFNSSDTIGELASTKTGAHTIAFGTTTPTIGKWSVSGSVTDGVTVTNTGSGIILAGEGVATGVDYLSMTGSIISPTSPVEFYAGLNSGVASSGAIATAKPAAVTRYWVGGTGTWDATTTTNWSASSGGSGGASVPKSMDTVIFDSASNATAYTVTLTATQLRCASLTVAGPASGNVTFAGAAPLSVTQAFTMASTGVTNTYSGLLIFSGTGSGKTISAGLSFPGDLIINGIGASWSLTAGLTLVGTNLTVTNGSFDTAGYAVSIGSIATSATNLVTLSFGSSAISLTGTSNTLNFTNLITTLNPVNLTFNCGTSSITMSSAIPAFYHGGKTFYNVSYTQTSAAFSWPFNQSIFTPTFNNLTFTLPTLGNGIRIVSLSSNLIINGSFIFSGTGTGVRRIQIASDTIGTQRTITAASVTGMSDVDLRDINCAGAATWTGTRIGDLGGNTNAPVSTPKTVYWNLLAGGNWSATAWAPSSGGTPAINNFPLAQDTAIIENTGLNTSATITMELAWNIGTVNISGRTNAMTFATSTIIPTIYGNLTFGTGVTTTGTGNITFSGRGTQTITSNGRTFTQPITINSFNGTVQLADPFTCAANITHTSGTFNAVSYNVTCTTFTSSNSNTRTLSMGSGLWTLNGSGTIWSLGTTTGLTFNKGSANILATYTTSPTFAGGGLTYNKLTLGGTGAGVSLTISGNNTFSEIASTRTAAHTITLGTSTQTVAAFTAIGSAGNLLTIRGSSITSFATLIYTGATYANLNYIVPTFLKVYDLNSDWYTGTNSTNGGSYGWIWAAGAVAYSAGGQFLIFF